MRFTEQIENLERQLKESLSRQQEVGSLHTTKTTFPYIYIFIYIYIYICVQFQEKNEQLLAEKSSVETQFDDFKTAVLSKTSLVIEDVSFTHPPSHPRPVQVKSKETVSTT